MAASGAKLVEVGTTNKTHARDYEKAITPNTAAILRVHPSNYKILGFTAEVPLAELVAIGHARGLVVIDDLGAGPLLDFSRFGFDEEPTLQQSVQAGADLITSSADKLIGASQGGIILGRADLIQAVRKNPMARMMRVGKLTLAVLEATLSLFLDEDRALTEVPTLRMLRRSLEDIAAQAERIARAINERFGQSVANTLEGFSQMGSGSLPGQNLPTRLVAVSPKSLDPGELSARLRLHNPPVFARVHKGQVLADPRTLLEDDEAELVEAVVDGLQIRN
jgi:L-seryl-tRNA(Ser) seleniumtransferase